MNRSWDGKREKSFKAVSTGLKSQRTSELIKCEQSSRYLVYGSPGWRIWLLDDYFIRCIILDVSLAHNQFGKIFQPTGFLDPVLPSFQSVPEHAR